MPAGMPISAGTSKFSIARTKLIIHTARIAGRRIRKVIWNVVRTMPVPEMTAASSSDGSIERNDALKSRNASGIWSLPKTQIIPAML